MKVWVSEGLDGIAKGRSGRGWAADGIVNDIQGKAEAFRRRSRPVHTISNSVDLKQPCILRSRLDVVQCR